MIVEELISLLKEGNQKAEVVFVDHYGNPIKTSKFTFCFTNINNACFDSSDKKNSNFLMIEFPHLGPEPD